MAPQRPPAPASYTKRNQQEYQLPPNTPPNESDSAHDEKDAYERQLRIRTERDSKSSYGGDRDSIVAHPFPLKTLSPPSPRSTPSISSAGQRHCSIPAIQYSPQTIKGQTITYPPQAYFDPEKHGYGSSQGCRSPNRVSGSEADAVVCRRGEYHEKAPEEKAWQLLFYLSSPCALLSVGIALWTIVAVLMSLALAPLRLCSTQPPLSTQLTSLLAPALNMQLHLIYSHSSALSYSSTMLVVIHLFSPIVALGVAIASWTAAAFWIFTFILGDPGVNDGRNDGKESILGVRNWWERWLTRGLRETTV